MFRNSRSIASAFDVAHLLLGRELIIAVDILTWLALPLWPLIIWQAKCEAYERQERRRLYYSSKAQPYAPTFSPARMIKLCDEAIERHRLISQPLT